jgi:hypothetical protein
MAGAKRRLAAILSADVAGYSRLMGADEEATVAAAQASPLGIVPLHTIVIRAIAL